MTLNDYSDRLAMALQARRYAVGYFGADAEAAMARKSAESSAQAAERAAWSAESRRLEAVEAANEAADIATTLAAWRQTGVTVTLEDEEALVAAQKRASDLARDAAGWARLSDEAAERAAVARAAAETQL